VFTIKLLTKLEEKYVRFEGLNLSWETLEGIVKHNGPLIGSHSKGKEIDRYILDYNKNHDLQLDKFPSLEAQVASMADDIAYNCHDLEDSFRAKLFTLEDLYEANVFNDIIDEVVGHGYKVSRSRIINEILKKITNMLIVDIIENSNKNIIKRNIKTFKDVQDSCEYLIKFSGKVETKMKKLRNFFDEKMYPHRDVREIIASSQIVVGGLFELYLESPGLLPEKWRNKISKNKAKVHMIICDYIAGMTDRFAMKEYEFLKGSHEIMPK
jgi:dGTPase